MDDDSNITRLEAVIGKSDRENDSVMFPNHDCNDCNG